jgi:hypothetical protein
MMLMSPWIPEGAKAGPQSQPQSLAGLRRKAKCSNVPGACLGDVWHIELAPYLSEYLLQIVSRDSQV